MEFLKLLYIYHKLMHFLVLIIKNIDYFEIYGLLIVSYLANLMWILLIGHSSISHASKFIFFLIKMMIFFETWWVLNMISKNIQTLIHRLIYDK